MGLNRMALPALSFKPSGGANDATVDNTASKAIAIPLRADGINRARWVLVSWNSLTIQCLLQAGLVGDTASTTATPWFAMGSTPIILDCAGYTHIHARASAAGPIDVHVAALETQ